MIVLASCSGQHTESCRDAFDLPGTLGLRQKGLGGVGFEHRRHSYGRSSLPDSRAVVADKGGSEVGVRGWTSRCFVFVSPKAFHLSLAPFMRSELFLHQCHDFYIGGTC